MAYFGITATDAGLRPAVPGPDLGASLARAAQGAGRTGAPLVVLIHGYTFHPGEPEADPHRSLFAMQPEPGDRRIRSWPQGLGFADDAGETGLCIGFGWPASAPHLASLRATGRNGFARVYERAAAYGARLAELVALLQRRRPAGRSTCSRTRSAPGWRSRRCRTSRSRRGGWSCSGRRSSTPGARDFLARLAGAAAAEVYNVTARANDLYDLMFETFAPRPRLGRAGDRAAG